MKERTQKQHREALSAQMARNGGRLPMAPDGPVLDAFKSLELAQAVEHEVNRAASNGHTKVTLTFDLHDAAEFASFLRRASLLGA